MCLSRWFNNSTIHFSSSENRQNNIYSGSICLKVDHISMIIGCDLLKKLSANLNFENEICVMKQPTVKTRNNEFLGIIMNNIENKPTTIKLNPRVEQIHLADSDTSEEQNEQLIRIMNKYEMCFANNLMELGRTSVLEYDIETVRYRQIPLTKRSQQIATMSIIIGDFSPTTCIFGLKNLPFVFTRLMDKIFSSIRGKYMEFFLDDIIIYSTTFEEHVCHIEQVMIRLQNAQLTAKPVKTFICKKTVQYLGFMINKNGITATEENIEKIKNYQIPKTVKEARSYLGLINFYRKHIASFANYAVKIRDLTKKKTGPFVWTKEANEAFEILKKKLISAPILAFPDMKSEEPLILTVDTSSTGIGYVLSQRQILDHTGKLIERPISYGSTHLRGSQTKMGSTEYALQ